MSIAELMKTAQFVVDSKGNKKAVMLSFSIWEELLVLLEDLEDIEEIRQLRGAKEEAIPWEEAKQELRAQGTTTHLNCGFDR